MVYRTSFAIGYAENECVETHFPAHNPVPDVPELTVNNPMTPLNSDSFWSTVLRPFCGNGEYFLVSSLIGVVDSLFCEWKKRFKNRTELPISRKPYMLDDQGLTIGAGITQIIHYANETSDDALVSRFREMQQTLKKAKTEFFDMVVNGMSYFGARKKPSGSVMSVTKAVQNYKVQSNVE